MPTLPKFNPARFRSGEAIDNKYYPLTPGTVSAFEGVDAHGQPVEANDFFTTGLTRNILGVKTTAVRDTAYDEGRLAEETIDFFAQDKRGNVWYFGEKVTNYVYDDDGNFIGTNQNGSWLAGQAGALPGVVMPATPKVGQSFYNEFAPGVALDETLIADRHVRINTQTGHYNTLKTIDSTALEPGIKEFKYYAPGVGLVRVEEEFDKNGVPNLVNELRDTIHAGSSHPPDGAEVVKRHDFISDGEARWVTILSEDSKLSNSIGYYTFDRSTGVIGEGGILFADSDHVGSNESGRIRVADGQGIGLFVVPDGADLGVDLTEYREGGLFFENMLTGKPARLSDGMAPIVTDADGDALPIPIFHALGAKHGANLLNPGLGLQAVEWDNDSRSGEGTLVLGFEDQRATQKGYDGDFNDIVIAFSSNKKGEEDKVELLRDTGGEDAPPSFDLAVSEPPHQYWTGQTNLEPLFS
ncbi:hypothetical protein M0208_03825 [Sphingomonas sp. SUN019]|uniref:hypothetical protein n=1 Tax=Sphingomonas sp. SUN019 TaxID=2937788 RepID=UPI00216401FD|nr:hypothetical protein [Sphingomonas sp. SUN019]UVO49681.1 hypothetical protein M0208_03825 [Sphingomonas sp. SUN019]